MVAIEESKDPSPMNIEELQGLLEAHELKLKQKSSEKVTKQVLQALQTQVSKKVNLDGYRLGKHALLLCCKKITCSVANR